jgi:apolipoprotein N-acyltransferase
MARIRAVESGRYIVRAMKTGISAIIDPTGRELRRSVGSEGVLLEENVAAMDHRTLYVRAGDWVIWAAVLVIVIAALLPRIAAARRARAGQANLGAAEAARPKRRRRKGRGRQD